MSMEEAKKIAEGLGLDQPDNGVMLAREAEMTGQSEEKEPRDLELITEEIVFYKRQAGASILEIGKRLNEAKAQLEHGQWLSWLREKIDLSERSATNFMRLEKEYGKSEIVADLGAVKALKLLELSPNDRDAFIAEKHLVDGEEKSVSDMTGQELTKTLRERDEAREKILEAEQTAKQLRTQAAEARENLQRLSRESLEKERALERKLVDAKEKNRSFRESEQQSREEVKKAREELEALKKKPVEVAVAEPSPKVLQKLREEAEAAAAEKVRESEARFVQAQAKAEAAAEEAEKFRRELAASDRDTQAVMFFFGEVQSKFSNTVEALKMVREKDKEKADKLKEGICVALRRMLEELK